MKRTTLLLSICSLVPALLFSSPSDAPAQASSQASLAQAWIIPLHGDIEPASAAFIRREATRAVREGANIIIFDIDTFGGRVDTALQISSSIGSLKEVYTVAWVRSGAGSYGVSWSAGALIAMSCQAIYMAPGTSIGAAAPVAIGVDGQPSAVGEKTVSALRSQMAALAEKNGYPEGIALAMVDQSVVLWEVEHNGQTRLLSVPELERLEREDKTSVIRVTEFLSKEKLLSLSAGQAERYQLSSGTVETKDDLLQILGANTEPIELKQSVADSIVAFLTSGAIQTLLILLGLVALFLEINSPGFGVPGTIAIIAFLGVFGANALLGTVGSLEMILFLLGLGLLAVEIFILPGFGVAGISGLLLIAAALVLSMQDFVIPSVNWQWDVFGRNIIVVALGLLAAITGIAVIALSGTRLRIFNRLTLHTSISATASSDAGLHASQFSASEAEQTLGGLIGKKGVAVSTLRPSGKAEIDGHRYVVESDGEFIEEGSALSVVAVKGNVVVVESRKQS